MEYKLGDGKMEFFTKPLSGKIPLWKAYWVNKILFTMILWAICITVIYVTRSPAVWQIALGVFFCYGIWASTSLWKCAGTSPGLFAIMARTNVAIEALVLVGSVAATASGMGVKDMVAMAGKLTTQVI